MKEDVNKLKEQYKEMESLEVKILKFHYGEIKKINQVSSYRNCMSLKIDGFPEEFDFSPLISDNKNILENLREVELGTSLYQTSGSTMSTALGSQAVLINAYEKSHEKTWQSDLSEIVDSLYDLATSQYTKSEIIDLMNRFYMGKNIPGKLSPTSAFEEAWETFDHRISTDSANGSLSSMRSCLGIMSDRLTQMKPVQEGVGKKNKISSICNQLCKAGIPDKTKSDWNKEYQSLQNELSGFKHDMFSIDDWKRLLDRGTALIFNILSGLESEKLKIPRNFK